MSFVAPLKTPRNPRPPPPTLKTFFPASVPPLCQRRPSEPARLAMLTSVVNVAAPPDISQAPYVPPLSPT